MPYIQEVYCVKCNTKVKETDTNCPKCNFLLVSNKGVKVKKNYVSETEVKLMKNIYKDNFKNLSKITKKEKLKKHNINSTFPVWACIVLNFITFGLFTLIYFGIKHGKLPQIDEDPSTGQAIGYMFIPFYNIYWRFFYWLRLTDRINLQYKLRGKEIPIDRTFVKITLILSVIPYVWYVEMFILMPIVIGIVQSASNNLVKIK